MKDLRKKIFLILSIILSTTSIILFCIFNVGIYNRESERIENQLVRISNNGTNFNPGFINDENPFFIEDEIYIVKFDIFGNVDNIITNTPESLSRNEVIGLIKNNTNKIKKEKMTSIVFNDYVFFLNKNNSLVIMNNQNNRHFLLKNFVLSLLILIIVEILIFYLSKIITKWIANPVEDMFNKQKQFISDASHELKTPLSIISASAQTIEGKVKDKKWIANIKEETDGMSHLVNDLLELSRTENLNQTKSFELINISKLIENKSLSFESLMYESGLKLELDITDDIKLKCDSDRIKELLGILIDNAIKHAYPNTTVKIELSKTKNEIILNVINNGDEIPPGERTKIFERFYRIDKSRNRDENRYGLGLSIAKNIAINHNGKISVSCNNGYTTFKVNLKQN